MALFSGTSGSGRRPLGPRPFSGGQNSAHAPVLRPHGDPRRATAAPFQAIAELPAPEETTLPNAPVEVSVFEEPRTVSMSDLATLPETPIVESISPASVLRIDDIRSEPYGWDRPVESPASARNDEPEPVAEAPAAVMAVPEDEPVIEAPGFVSDDAPAWDDLSLPDDAGIDDASVDMTAVDDRFDVAPMGFVDASDLEEPLAEPEAWIAAVEAPSMELADVPTTADVERVEIPTLETDAIVAIDERAALAPEFETVQGEEGVPDESWWPAHAEAFPAFAPMELTPVAVTEAAPRPTTPVDGRAAFEALVTETQGAERAVEVLEAVARMVRSREIVVSVGAGATAESVLASILASLLSHPS